MVPRAVAVDRPGQKPCYSVVYICGINLFKRSTKILAMIRYHKLVTEIGLRLAGSSDALSGLGMAVIIVVIKG